jgi:hypothetical protein
MQGKILEYEKNILSNDFIIFNIHPYVMREIMAY